MTDTADIGTIRDILAEYGVDEFILPDRLEALIDKLSNRENAMIANAVDVAEAKMMRKNA